MTTITNRYITAEQNNELMNLGYNWKVEGDWFTLGTIDPWSGMPNVDGKLHFFTDYAEAEAYAMTQTWIFNDKIHSKVEKVEHAETEEEYEARLRKARVEYAEKEAKRKAEKEARDLAKGITPEMRKAMTAKKRREAELRKMLEEAEKLNKRIEEKRKEIERLTREANG